MELGKVAGRVSQDLQWLAFQAQYCTGKNWSSRLCSDFDIWAGALAALVLAFVLWWLVKKLRAYLAYRAQFKIADAETMARYRWTGDDKAPVELSDAEVEAKIQAAMRTKRP